MAATVRGEGDGATSSGTGPTTDLVVAWDAARAAGDPAALEDLCPDDADRLRRLRERIEQVERGYHLLAAPGGFGPPSGPPPQGLPSVEGFEVIEEIGRGGMGVVYRAWQGGLQRFVALKMIAPGGRGAVARFLEEARAIAALSHPHIVAAYAFGEAACGPYLVCEHLAGGTLAGRWAGEPQPPREAAALLRTLALAVAHAHDREVVHRDLKPENILFSEEAAPKIGDFGLARIVEGEDRLSLTGEILGTPGYMAPEQAAGAAGRGERAVDVYALGAILYEGLTGRPPFRGAGRAETLRLVVEGCPIPPRGLSPSIPRDLETICLKCLRKEPSRRYSSAADLAADLGRFLDGSPVHARPVGRLERAGRALRRRPAATAVAITMVVALAAVGANEARWARESRRREVEALVGTLAAVETSAAPDILRRLGPHRDLARPLLRKRLGTANDPRERLHVTMALLPDDPTLAASLIGPLVDGPADARSALRDAIAPHRAAVLKAVSGIFDDPSADAARRLRAAAVLMEVDPNHPRLADAPALAKLLAAAPPPVAGPRWGSLRQVAIRALPGLADFLADGEGLPAERRAAVAVYAACATAGPSPLEARLSPTGHGGAAARARAAAALLAMGRGDAAWLLLRSTSPEVRRRLIDEIPAAGVDQAFLLARLRDEPDASARQALVLALGGYDLVHEPLPDRATTLAYLFSLYRDDPDPGVHGSLHWLLEREGESSRVREADRESKASPQGDQRWTVNIFSDVFSIVDIPDEASGEPYRLAVSSTEAVMYRYRQFLAALKVGRRPSELDALGRHRDGPALGVSRDEAAAYCNWLSRQDAMPRDQWCYVPGETGAGLRLASDYRERAGYRLPTAAEWEKLRRAGGSSTYLADPDLLSRYARWAGNSDGHSWSVGTSRPDDLGLFDMQGNAAELCESPVSIRGGSFRSSTIIGLGGTTVSGDDEVGLRPVRILRDHRP